VWMSAICWFRTFIGRGEGGPLLLRHNMTLWIKYRQQAVDITGPALGDIDDFRYVTAGGLINF